MGASPAPAGSNRSGHGGDEILKPSISVSRIGDSASVQAATRVNAVQASKRTMCRPTRLPFRGRLTRLGGMSEGTPSRYTGVLAAACTQGNVRNRGSPKAWSAMTGHARGADTWAIVENGEVRATYPFNAVRLSLVWKAKLETEADSESLDLDQVMSIFVTDLRKRKVDFRVPGGPAVR